MSAPPLPERAAGRPPDPTGRPPDAPTHTHDLELREVSQALAARRLTALDGTFIGLLALTIVLDVICAVFALGWSTAAATDAICALYVLGMALARPAWRPLLARLFALGLAAGVLELFTDFAGERVAHSLTYPAGEPLLWGSPYYMPLSWAIVLTQLGYLAWRLRSLAPREQGLADESAPDAPLAGGPADESAPKGVPPQSPPARAGVRGVPLWLAIIITGLAGAALVPFYEEMAWYARWWHYSPVELMVGHTPVYVLVFEGLVAALLPLLVGGLMARPLRYAVALGLLEGIWMPVAALAAWLVVGR
ncbi:MAG TPA: hypothetical protein VF116_00515 [Ktedonobacterales bacterium]